MCYWIARGAKVKLVPSGNGYTVEADGEQSKGLVAFPLLPSFTPETFCQSVKAMEDTFREMKGMSRVVYHKWAWENAEDLVGEFANRAVWP